MAAAVVTTGSAWPGGVQPAGGTNALFGSAGRAGAAATAEARRRCGSSDRRRRRCRRRCGCRLWWRSSRCRDDGLSLPGRRPARRRHEGLVRIGTTRRCGSDGRSRRRRCGSSNRRRRRCRRRRGCRRRLRWRCSGCGDDRFRLPGRRPARRRHECLARIGRPRRCSSDGRSRRRYGSSNRRRRRCGCRRRLRWCGRSGRDDGFGLPRRRPARRRHERLARIGGPRRRNDWRSRRRCRRNDCRRRRRRGRRRRCCSDRRRFRCGGGGGGAAGAVVIATRVTAGMLSAVATAGAAAMGAIDRGGGPASDRCSGPDRGSGGGAGGAGVTLVTPSGLPGSAAAGLPGSPVAGPVRGSGLGSLALASFSAASRSRRASRALASRSAASFSTASRCAFWPPLPATIEPICGVCPRVSSAADRPCSYCWPGLADGSAPLAWIWRSAPGRSLVPCGGALSPNQPQPESSARLDTPSKPSQLLPILSCPLRIAILSLLETRPSMLST